jgi:very-short-patch-repair endonuclease
VELDGHIHAGERLRDARRDNAALLDGEVTLRYGWRDVTERSCRVAWEVAAILRAQGGAASHAAVRAVVPRGTAI